MNIALIGYGKMGHAIEQIAVMRGHSIVQRITTANRATLIEQDLKTADVAIEFTRPDAAPANVNLCLRAGIPLVCGTTGWNDELDAAKRLCNELNGALLQASNFSVGVNIFFEVNKVLARLMNHREEYGVLVEETHHTQKKDAPSGTAITLAEGIISEIPAYKGWQLGEEGAEGNIPIAAHRIEGVPGTHVITYKSAIDDISISHTAHSRDGFAMGAVLAAEFLQGKHGVFSMKDVLGIGHLA